MQEVSPFFKGFTETPVQEFDSIPRISETREEDAIPTQSYRQRVSKMLRGRAAKYVVSDEMESTNFGEMNLGNEQVKNGETDEMMGLGPGEKLGDFTRTYLLFYAAVSPNTLRVFNKKLFYFHY